MPIMNLFCKITLARLLQEIISIYFLYIVDAFACFSIEAFSLLHRIILTGVTLRRISNSFHK